MADSDKEPNSRPGRIELEAKVTFLERTVEVMSKAMHEQGIQMGQLERRLAGLENKIEAADQDGAGHGLRPHDDPPPHY